MIDALKIRLLTLRGFYEQYEKAEGNPHFQNTIICAMRYECDKLNVSVLDYIQRQRTESGKVTEQKPEEVQELAVAVPTADLEPAPAVASFTCPQCGKIFPTQKALSGHQKAHRKEYAISPE
jgi:predicted RNA-binding Zn-ribbon protein involved in translation (DUF1610 family)